MYKLSSITLSLATGLLAVSLISCQNYGEDQVSSLDSDSREIIAEQSTKGIEKVSPNDFAVRIRNNPRGVQLIDVRTPREFQAGHIEGAVLMDMSRSDVFTNAVERLDKNAPVYVYCAVGGRSAAAAKNLASRGFSQIVELDGGIEAWQRAGKNTVR